MAPAPDSASSAESRPWSFAASLGVLLVLLGMANNIPSIPGLDDAAVTLTGNPGFVIRKFPFEWLYPLAFAIMMTVVVLHYSAWRIMTAQDSRWRFAGLGLDGLTLLATLAVVLAYLTENSAVCLIDQVTGLRAELIARSLEAEIAFAESIGLPPPDTVDDPQCVNTTGTWLFAIVGASIAVFLAYCVRVWGFPLVLIAILIAGYTAMTVALWYFYGTDGFSKYLVTKLGGEPRQLIDGRTAVQDILVSNARGLLGQFMGVLLSTVFPYIVLGALFGSCSAGGSLVKLALIATRRITGGPAHAAIVSSALFGTISGGPVVNVLSTGPLTIPMMLRVGYNRVFAGGVEAAASTGGQITPPVMGVAVFVLASLTLVPYREVVIAASLPALAYFVCLLHSATFQARKQGIRRLSDSSEAERLTRQDALNLLVIFAPIVLILVLLLLPKDAITCSSFRLLGAAGCAQGDLTWVAELIRNTAGDAGSAGWWAAVLLFGLLFTDPQMRARPRRFLDMLANAGITVSGLYLMFLSVSVIDFCLNFTGLSNAVARDILLWLNSFGESGVPRSLFVLIALSMTMTLAILLGMGMPTVPAYLNVALLIGPLLSSLGIAVFTAHMFVFYFAVASAITPPVAVAAFAAASITKADPLATGLSAVRSGIVIFVIPFVFAFYPQLLLIDAAILNPDVTSGARYIAGYDGARDPVELLWLLARLGLALYLVSSALVGFDRSRLPMWEVALRLLLALGAMMRLPEIHFPAAALALALIAAHALRNATPARRLLEDKRQ